MKISPRILEIASRLTERSPDELKTQVKHTQHLSPASEQDFADLMADRAQVVAYEYTDPLGSLVGTNPRQRAAMQQLYTHTSESRSEGFSLIREIESDPKLRAGTYTAQDSGEGLVELSYRIGDEFARVLVDTTPGQPGEQYLIADVTPILRQAFGLGKAPA
jgi:hypothetical protein